MWEGVEEPLLALREPARRHLWAPLLTPPQPVLVFFPFVFT